MKIALVQQEMTTDMASNLQHALDAIDHAASNGANIVCFPEIQLSPFFPQFSGRIVDDYAIGIEDEMVKKIQDKCKEHNLIAIPNIYLQEGEHRFDASPVIDGDGSILGISKMVHIAQLPCFYEQDYYTPSDGGFEVYDTQVGKVGVVICFDRHLPESIRTCAAKGAQIIVIPTANTKDEPMEMFEWEMRIQAMQNNVFIAMCNRVGKEGKMDFSGESLVIAPDGSVLDKADDSEQTLFSYINLSMVEQTREQRPYITLRRPECYL